MNNTTIVSNEEIILRGNLTIGSNGSLVLERVMLWMNATTNGGLTIRIDAGGEFRILNSTITSYTSYYKFEAYGRLSIFHSVISHLWGQANSPVGGIQVYSSAVTIFHSTISDSMSSAVYADGHYPVVSYSILNDSVYGLYLEGVSDPDEQVLNTLEGGVTERYATIPTGGGNV